MAFEKNNEYAFKKGSSGHPEGGVGKRVRRSKLRQTVEKLRELEPLALENIKKSVEGNQIDKEVLQSSKWALEKISSFTIAAIQEEEKNANLKFKHQEAAQAEDEEIEKEEATPKPARFQLTVVE